MNDLSQDNSNFAPQSQIDQYNQVDQHNQADQTDLSVRPKRLEDFIGQNELRANLRVYLQAAREQQKALDHVLFHGSPGLGKTTLAQIMASELGVNLVCTSGPVLDKSGDLAAILSNLSRYDLLFVDEIHRMPIAVEEILYPALEDFRLDLVVGQGASARSVRVDLEPFTLVGATTRLGLLSAPLRDRFGIIARLDYYNPEDLARIVLRSASILNVVIDQSGALEIGRRSRGTPRIANRLLRRVQDFALVHGAKIVGEAEAKQALERLDVDKRGLDWMDRKILEVMAKHYDGGPVGIKTLSVACNEEVRTLEEIYEPYLIQCGFIKRTARGRMLTNLGYKHLRELTKLEAEAEQNEIMTEHDQGRLL